MCGIAGLVELGGAPVDTRLVSLMLDRLVHRGPDGGGLFVDDGRTLVRSPHGAPGPTERTPRPRYRHGPTAVLGHRRLAITDLSPRGAQPMSWADGRYFISFNGAIYNALELRAELTRDGDRFRTTTDTEVVLAAFARWGESALHRFDGMWALAIWDTERRELFLARDRLGEKGLCYRHDGERLAFASEPKGLRPVAPAVADMAVMQRFLTHGIVCGDEESPFRGISMLPAGCTLRAGRAGVRVNRYYELDAEAARRGPPASYPHAVDEVRSLLASSVERRLRADVTVGACLSGGLDSSAITALAARSHRDKKWPLITVSTSYTDRPDIDESLYARFVARAVRADPRFVEPSEDEFDRDLDAHVAALDDVFPHSGSFAQRVVYRTARGANLKVMLSGQGADELFGGYEPWAVYLAGLRSEGRNARAVVEGFLSGRRQSGLLGGLRRAVGEAGRGLRERLGRTAGQTVPEIPQWVGERVKDGADQRLVWQPATVLGDYLGQQLLRDHLPALLRFEDRNSMAAGVEARLPFLEVRLIELARTLPADWLLRLGWTKAVLREAMTGIVPETVRMRKGKLGFPGPIEASPRDRTVMVRDAWGRLETGGWVKGHFPAEPSSVEGRALGLRARVLDSFVRGCLGSTSAAALRA
jgi:asparagine synthase (glutamine-hydrolysing)